MGEDKLRLRKLLEHWVEHNKAHGESFREWAEKAEGMGLSSVAAHLSEAVKGMEEVVKSLQMALRELS